MNVRKKSSSIFQLLLFSFSNNKRLWLLPLYFLLFLVSLVSVSATTNDAEYYYSYDVANVSGSTLIDISGNGNDGTCTNMGGDCNTVPGILLNASDFSGGSDYVDAGTKFPTTDDAAFSISAWANGDTLVNPQYIASSGITGGQFYGWRLHVSGSNQISFNVRGNSADYTVSKSSLNTSQWYHLVGTYDGSTVIFYVDGVQVGNVTSAFLDIASGTNTLYIGEIATGAGQEFAGLIDETGIYNRALTPSEVTELYNNGGAFNPYAITPTPTIQSNLSSYYNTSNISVQLNTTSNVNMSYILNNGSETSICSDCNNSVVNLTLIEGLNNISWIAVNSNGNSTNAETTTLDTNLPVINNNILTEYNSYTINGFNSSCSDTNLDYCNISINSQNVLLNTTSFTFTENGNFSYNITAKDLAGNIVTETGVTLVNPYQTFYFEDINGTPLTNFTFGGKSSEGNSFVQFKVYNDTLSLGTNSLTFEKESYVTTNFNITLNTTSDINITYSIVEARIEFYIYDQVTNILITNQTVTLELIGDVTLESNTTTGFFNITSLLVAGEYQAKMTTDNYVSTEKAFTFDAASIFVSNFYMIPVNYTLSGYVVLITYDTDNTFAPEIVVTANQWDSSTSSFIETFRTRTNPNGRAVVPIILEDELYQFCAEYASGEVCFPSGNIGQSFSRTQNGEEIPILQSINFPTVQTFDNLNFTLLYNNLTNYSSSFFNYSVGYTFQTLTGADTTVCAKIEKDFNFTKTLVSSINCTTTNSGSFFSDFLLNDSFSYIFTVYEMANDGSSQELFVDYIPGEDNLITQLDNFKLLKFLQVALVIIMIGAIPFLKYPLLIIGDVLVVFIVSWRYLMPQDLSITTVGVFIVLGIITLWAVSKK